MHTPAPALTHSLTLAALRPLAIASLMNSNFEWACRCFAGAMLLCAPFIFVVARFDQSQMAAVAAQQMQMEESMESQVKRLRVQSFYNRLVVCTL
jgi:hypothetical protein